MATKFRFASAMIPIALSWLLLCLGNQGIASDAVKGRPKILFMAGTQGTNAYAGNAFAANFGSPRGAGPAGDGCSVLERHGPRRFRGPIPIARGARQVWMHFSDRRKPALVIVRRWGADPNAYPSTPLRTLPLRHLTPIIVAGVARAWQGAVMVPPDAASFLVARVVWPDDHDCSAGPDFVASGISISPPLDSGEP
jgi:hypothetical protein